MTHCRGIVAVFLTAFTVAMGLSGCGPANPSAAPRVELLTAEEVGGVMVPLKGNDSKPASDCGPDMFFSPTEPGDYSENVVRFDTGGRVVVVGAWDANWYEVENPPGESMRKRADEFCLGEVSDYERLEFSTLEGFSHDAFAFQSVSWGVRNQEFSLPPSPIMSETTWSFVTSRAYGIIGENVVMVRIDVQDRSVEPPSEEELRTLWDAQVAKILEHSTAEESQS